MESQNKAENVGKGESSRSQKSMKLADKSHTISKRSPETNPAALSPNEKRVRARDGVELLLFYQGSCFSNFYPCEFTIDGITYNTSEQYFMHQKAITFGDDAIAAEILKSDSPKFIKSLGRKVKNYNWDIWNNGISETIMEKGVLAKFQQNDGLKACLLATDPAIIAEASPRDRNWGIGLGVNSPKALNYKNWPGKNKLGNVLMKVRETCKNM